MKTFTVLHATDDELASSANQPVQESFLKHLPVRSDGVHAHPLQGTVSDAQSTECPATSEQLNQQDELAVEGGTISISSAYSQGCVISKSFRCRLW